MGGHRSRLTQPLGALRAVPRRAAGGLVHLLGALQRGVEERGVRTERISTLHAISDNREGGSVHSLAAGKAQGLHAIRGNHRGQARGTWSTAAAAPCFGAVRVGASKSHLLGLAGHGSSARGGEGECHLDVLGGKWRNGPAKPDICDTRLCGTISQIVWSVLKNFFIMLYNNKLLYIHILLSCLFRNHGI